MKQKYKNFLFDTLIQYTMFLHEFRLPSNLQISSCDCTMTFLTRPKQDYDNA